jgi:hypothetical protein
MPCVSWTKKQTAPSWFSLRTGISCSAKPPARHAPQSSQWHGRTSAHMYSNEPPLLDPRTLLECAKADCAPGASRRQGRHQTAQHRTLVGRRSVAGQRRKRRGRPRTHVHDAHQRVAIRCKHNMCPCWQYRSWPQPLTPPGRWGEARRAGLASQRRVVNTLSALDFVPVVSLQ